MYRGASSTLDEHDRAVGAILIAETLIEQCERAIAASAGHGQDRWRALVDLHDDYAEIWRQLDRAQRELSARGANTRGYEELRPHVRPAITRPSADARRRGEQELDPEALEDVRRGLAELKLALPGTDWRGIARRSGELVAIPQLRQSHRGAVAGILLALGCMAGTLVLGALPVKQESQAVAVRRDIDAIARFRKVKIQVLAMAVGAHDAPHCRAANAQEYVKLLVMDGRGDDAERFADAYLGTCGEDDTIERWANAPRPR